MANPNLFPCFFGPRIPVADGVNSEGVAAYAFTPRQALAQYAATGTLNHTFYASAEMQLSTLLELASNVEATFLAQTAIYCRERDLMKDTPAVLLALLSVLGPGLLPKVFPRVIDNGRMLRNFVQVMRSGVVGRKSLGSMPKRLVQQWLEERSDAALFRDSVGQSPSIADVVKMVHPKPGSAARKALYAYLVGRPYDAATLPPLVTEYEAFKAGSRDTVPDVPFQMLTSLELDAEAWKGIAQNAPWQMLRMNLNTFARHGVFANETVTRRIATTLADADAIRRARAYPYQLMMAFTAAKGQVPECILHALAMAMELAVENVPRLDGRLFICVDVSGSMSSPVTGYRDGATTAVRCIDVAALMVASMLRRNPNAEVIAFNTHVVPVRLSAFDSVMTNAAKLAALGGGGTNCSAPLAFLNERWARGDAVVMVSDNESWVDAAGTGGKGTAMMRAWQEFKRRSPGAKLACIDLQPNRTAQVKDGGDVLNVGGFSDAVFDVLGAFVKGTLSAQRWVGEIEALAL